MNNNTFFKNLDNHFIRYNDKIINIIIDTDRTPWFHAKQLTLSLEYTNTKDAIKRNVKSINKKQKQDIKYKGDIPGHPHTMYINEKGLYSLMIGSKYKSAQKFKDWIAEYVLPSIRKYGEYKLTKEHSKEIEDITKKIQDLTEEKKQMEKELKKNKYPNSGSVYAIPYKVGDKKYFRIGTSNKMDHRMKSYDTHSPHKKEIAYLVNTKCPIKLERCVRALLYDYRYKDNKDFYECSLEKIKQIFDICIEGIKCAEQEKNQDQDNKSGGYSFLDHIIKHTKKQKKSLKIFR